MALHAHSTTGQLPTLSLSFATGEGEAGAVHGQTAALLRWAGRQSSLYPDDHEEQLLIDAAEELMVDIKTALGNECAVCGAQCAVRGVRCAVCSVRCAVCGVRCAVCGV